MEIARKTQQPRNHEQNSKGQTPTINSPNIYMKCIQYIFMYNLNITPFLQKLLGLSVLDWSAVIIYSASLCLHRWSRDRKRTCDCHMNITKILQQIGQLRQKLLSTFDF